MKISISLLIIVFFNLSALGQDCNHSDNWITEKQELFNFYRQWDLFYVTDKIGYTVGNGGSMRKTTDSGKSWEVLHDRAVLGTEATLECVYFIDENVGFTGGKAGVFMKTFDGGLTWELNTIPEVSTIYDLKFYNQNHGIGLFRSETNGTYIATTTDGGDFWSRQDSEIKGLEQFEFIHKANVTLVHGKTENGQQILVEINENGIISNQYELPNEFFSIFYFIDELNGIANGSYRTNDGGATWQTDARLPKINSQSIISFEDFQNGIIVNPVYITYYSSWELLSRLDGMESYETQDGGETWCRNESNRLCAIQGLITHSPNPGTTYFWGSFYDGKIEYNAFSTTDCQERPIDIDVFPNPAGNFITVTSSSPTAYRIKVYSTQGELMIDTPYGIGISITSLPAGIYYVKVLDTEHEIQGVNSFVKL